MTNSTTKISCLCWCVLLLVTAAHAQVPADAMEDQAVSLIRQIYKEISSDGSAPVDWDLVRSHFMEEAVIVLRSSAEGHTVFTLDGFIEDFKSFYKNPVVGKSGFKEEIIRIKPQIYRNAASIGVVYESTIPDSGRPPQQGIDFWLLIRLDNNWKVIGISNEIIPPGEEIPDMFQ